MQRTARPGTTRTNPCSNPGEPRPNTPGPRRPWPRWVPSNHHEMKTRTELRYYPKADDTATVSHLEVELDLPFWLWPFRYVIERKMSALKREKDDEDMEMIERRAKIYGRGNI